MEHSGSEMGRKATLSGTRRMAAVSAADSVTLSGVWPPIHRASREPVDGVLSRTRKSPGPSRWDQDSSSV